MKNKNTLIVDGISKTKVEIDPLDIIRTLRRTIVNDEYHREWLIETDDGKHIVMCDSGSGHNGSDEEVKQLVPLEYDLYTALLNVEKTYERYIELF